MKKILISILVTTALFSSGYSQTFISQTIDHDGLTREYGIYVPASYDGTTNFPLLFNLHGGGGTNSAWQVTSDMRPIADTANFILVYPQARPDPSDGNSFNWIPKVPGTFDDVPFFSSLIDTITSNYQIDQNRIYACGYSLGGDMTFELGCKLNNRIAAIALVARTMQANPNSFCSPVHPTGVLTILGTDDLVSPYNGIVFGGLEYYISAAATHSYWATHNKCVTTAIMSTVSPSVERYTWSTASGCAYVEELKVIGGGHDWPGSFGNMTIDANEEIWQFVSRYDINGLIGCATTSIHENNSMLENYRVYPNPVNTELTIDLGLAEEKEFRLYNPIGELVLNGVLNSQISIIDLSFLAPNVYILIIENQSTRLIKTK
ncbi:T9SS type A sorting domain-containing protein [Salibacteraceae bacterium]|nr:T9SS type A sorting domain-containing protein [Salibacteraceae bacterium]